MKKYILVFCLFCLCLFLIDNAYALDGSYSSSNFQITMMSGPSEDATSSSSGYSDGLNVSHNLNGKYLQALYIQVYGSNSIVYEAGNTYTFKFRVNFNPKKWNYLDNNYTTSNMHVFGSTNSSSSGMSTENITSSSLTITNMSNDNYGMYYTFKIVPNTDLKYILFRCRYPHTLMGPDLNYVYGINTVRVVNLSVTYQQGIGSAIDEQSIIIQNQTDKIVDTQKETNQKLDNLNDSLTSEESPNLDSLQNSSGWLPPGPIDSILNLPLSLLNNLNTNLSKKCQPVEVNLPYVDSTLSLPCLNTIYSQMGNLSSWINGVGIVAAAFILFKYFINLYKWVDDTLTFRENNWLDNWGGL